MIAGHFSPRKCVLLGLTMLALAPLCHSQISVNLEIPRRLYMVYEPLIVTVTITNLSGDRIMLRDTEAQQWMSFEIHRTDGLSIPPTAHDYKLEPLVLDVGETARRSINITPLYAIREFGTHRIKLNIFSADMDRYFQSAVRQVDITEGRRMYEQVVGVPGSGALRKVTLLSHRQPKGNRLYIRIMDEQEGTVYATAQIGRLLSFGDPRVEFDINNDVHILHMTSPRTFMYTYMSLNGEVLSRATYRSTERHPRLGRNSSGMVEVRGGVLDEPVPSTAEGAPAVPRISDRPPGAPGI